MKNKKNNKIVLVYGHFNVIHPGHLRFLRFAKECGNKLVVGIESDKIVDKSVDINEKLRFNAIKEISWVDEVFIYSENIKKIISKIKPHIVVKGKEHENLKNPEAEIVEKNGGKLIFSSGELLFSSIDLLKNQSSIITDKLNLQSNYLKRHKITSSRLKQIIKNFRKVKICVIGDLIIDQYIICNSLGMSQEDPSIVVTPIQKNDYIGGAGIVASHGSKLGANTFFISIVGDDNYADFAKQKLKENKVNFHLIKDDTRPTTLKKRYRSKGKTLLRVNNLSQNNISIDIQDRIFDIINKKINNFNIIIFSDFNYGCLPQKLVNKITKIAKKNNVKIISDSQSSSQIGNISRFNNSYLLTPTEYEARISTHNNEDGLVVLAEELRKKSSSRNIFLKLGEEGMLIHSSTKNSEWITDRIEAISESRKDVAGAGDSLLITSALSIALKSSIWESAYLGMIAAAIQVNIVGNIPLDKNKLIEIVDYIN